MQLIHVDSLDARQHAEEVRILSTAHGEGKKHTQIIDEFAELRLRADLPDTKRPVEVPDCLHRPTDRHTYPYYRVYQTNDGYIGIAALNKSLRDKVCGVLTIVDEHTELNMGDFSDEVYFKQKELMRTMESRFVTRSCEAWLQKLEAAGVPCGRVNYRADLYSDPQAQALDLVWSLENRNLGKYKAAGHPVRFSRTPPQPSCGAPALGEHSDAVLRECGYDTVAIAALRSQGIVK